MCTKTDSSDIGSVILGPGGGCEHRFLKKKNILLIKMAITKAMKELLQKSSTNVPERVTSRGSNALRLKLVDGKQVMLLNNKGVPTEYG